MRKPKPIYLDYAASTPLLPGVVRVMRRAERAFGNPSSLHSFGQAAQAVVDRAREKVAAAIGAPPAGGFREIIFTGSATEANNLALRGVVNAIRNARIHPNAPNESEEVNSDKLVDSHVYLRKISRSETFVDWDRVPKLIVSAIEHESVLETARDLERSGEAELVVIPVNRRGIVDVKALERALDERTVLVSVMYVNNETGVIQPIPEIAKIIRDFKIAKLQDCKIGGKNNLAICNLQSAIYPLFHTDAAQAFAYFYCNMNRLGVDLMTLSGHKIGGPTGIGALYVSRNCRIAELQDIKIRIRDDRNFAISNQQLAIMSIITGGNQEFGLRAGTENVPLIAGFAEAMTLAVKGRTKNIAHTARLKELFLKELKRARVKFIENVPRESASPHILNLRFPDLAAEELLVRLDLAGVAVSAGSACTARAVLPSHVLLAIGMPKREVEESIRVSFGVATTAAEVREAARRFAIATQEITKRRF